VPTHQAPGAQQQIHRNRVVPVADDLRSHPQWIDTALLVARLIITFSRH
jgi:hypothetical protein